MGREQSIAARGTADGGAIVGYDSVASSRGAEEGRRAAACVKNPIGMSRIESLLNSSRAVLIDDNTYRQSALGVTRADRMAAHRR